MIFLKSNLVSALATASVAAHFAALEKTDADDTKGSLDSQRSNCPLSFADLVINVQPFIGTGHGNTVE